MPECISIKYTTKTINVAVTIFDNKDGIIRECFLCANKMHDPATNTKSLTIIKRMNHDGKRDCPETLYKAKIVENIKTLSATGSKILPSSLS